MKLNLQSKWVKIAYLCSFLILLNIVIIHFFDITISRFARWGSTFFFLIFFAYYRGFKQKLVFSALLLFLLKDGLLINYEIPLHKTFSFIATILAYTTLILINFQRVKIVVGNPVLFVFAIAMLGLNAFNLFYLSDVIQEGLDNNIQFGFFFLQGVLLISLGLIAFAYNERYEGSPPLLFLYFSFCLILCDLSGLAAYFFKWEVAYFPERIFYLLALALLVNFALNRRSGEKEAIVFLREI